MPVAAAVVSDDSVAPRNVPCCQFRRFVDQRNPALPPRAEDDRVDRHAVRVVELRRQRRALRGRRGEAAVRVRGLLRRRRRPRPPLPVERLGRRRIVVPFPPRRAVGPQRHVREDRVALDHVERGRIGLPARAGDHAEEARFRVHRPEPAVRCRAAATRCRRRPSSPSSPAAPWAAPASPGWSCRRPTGTRRRCSASSSADPRGRGSACAPPASLPSAPASSPGAAPCTSSRAARCRRSPIRSTRPCSSRGSA